MVPDMQDDPAILGALPFNALPQRSELLSTERSPDCSVGRTDQHRSIRPIPVLGPLSLAELEPPGMENRHGGQHRAGQWKLRLQPLNNPSV